MNFFPLISRIFLCSLLCTLTLAATPISLTEIRSTPFGNQLFSDFLKSGIIKSNDVTRNITHLEFAVYLSRMLKITNDSVSLANPIATQLPVPAWARSSIQTLENKFGQLTPFYYTSFRSNIFIRKEYVAKLMNALINETPVQYGNVISNQSMDSGRDALNYLVYVGIMRQTDSYSISRPEASMALLRLAYFKKKQFFERQSVRSKVVQAQQNIKQVVNDISGIYVEDEFDQSLTSPYQDPKTETVAVIEDDSSEQLELDSPSLDTVSAVLTMSTNYVWRGMQQGKKGDPAISGGIDIQLTDNWYVGMWSANVNYSGADYEWDVFFGHNQTIDFFNIPIEIDMSVTNYLYPSATSEVNFSEFGTSLTFNNLSLSVFTLISGKNASVFADNYYNISYGFDLNHSFAIETSVGIYSGTFNVTGDQTDYRITLNKGDFNFDITALDSNLGSPTATVRYDISAF